MDRTRSSLLVILLLFTTGLMAQKETLNLGMVRDCPSDQGQTLIDLVVKETQTLLKSDYRVVLETANILTGDCGIEDARTNLNRLLADPNIDIVLGMDVMASHVMAKSGPYQKPVIAGIVLNAQVQGIPITSKGGSGVDNMTFLELTYSPVRDLEVFHNMIGFKKVALVIDQPVMDGIPEIRSYIDQSLTDRNFDHDFVYTESTAAATLAKIDNSFDAVYYFPSDRLNRAEFQKLIDGANDRQLRSFSIIGRPDVDRGVLGGVAPASNLNQIARRMALDIQRIVSGEKAAKLGTRMIDKEEFVINMATARKIDYSPSWETLSEALLINEERTDIARTIDLYAAIEEGLNNNLSIAIAENETGIVAEDVNVAKSSLLPEVTLSASHTLVDETTAEVSNGQNPQNKGSASLQASQVIYAEQVTANYRIQRYLLKAQEAAQDVQSLDIVLDVSSAYLNLMQAKTAERVRKENLEVTRKNLELARVSSSLGQTGPSDLYRLEGEIATAKANLLTASAQRRQAEMNLSQILNRPVSEEFNTAEVDLEDSRLVINDNRINSYVNNPRDFRRFGDFQVERAKEYAPTLQQFDYSMKAQERSVQMRERLRYMPSLTVGGGYNQELYRSGAGTEFPEFFGTPNDWNWNVQVGASLPIFQGGSRNAYVRQSRVQLQQVANQRLNTQRLIEQQVRSQLENIRASYTNIDLTKDAENAAVRNFDLVQDAYSKGAVTITQLLDAQNAAIQAQLNSANAIYLFLLDLLNMERATGSFYMLMTDDQKAAYRQELTSFFNQQ